MNPLILFIIYAFIFTVIFKNAAKVYPVYFFTGMLPWMWFSSAVMEGTNAIVTDGGFATKSIFPSEMVVIVRIFANFINYILAIPILFIFVFIWHLKIEMPVIILPIIIAYQFFYRRESSCFL